MIVILRYNTMRILIIMFNNNNRILKNNYNNDIAQTKCHDIDNDIK